MLNVIERRELWLYIREIVCEFDKVVWVEREIRWRSEEK